MEAKENLGHHDVSRREAALGREALKAMRQMKVLIVGLRGAGIETAKNVVLLGVHSVTVWDNQLAAIEDLGCNFYLREQHLKEKLRRAEACQPELQGLNPFCTVNTTDVNADALVNEKNVLQFTNVIVTDILGLTKTQLLKLSGICHENGIPFCMALTSGATASLFSDFGPNHTITDPDGVPTVMCVMESLELLELKEDLTTGCIKVPIVNEEGIQRGWEEDGKQVVLIKVTSERTKTVGDQQIPAHGFEYDRTPVRLEDLRGELAVLNGADNVYAKRVYRHKNVSTNGKTSKKQEQLFNMLALDCSAATERGTGAPIKVTPEMFQNYKTGGILNEMKPKSCLKFKSLADSFKDPSSDKHEFTKFLGPQHGNQARWEKGAGKTCHIAWLAALDFQEKTGHYPRLHNEDDAAEFLNVAASTLAAMPEGDMGPFQDEIDKKTLKSFALLFCTELTGFAAFLGGAVAQEIVKTSGKFSPIHQWLHLDDPFLISRNMSDTTSIIPSRYQHQISVFGEAWQQKVGNCKVFLVGCGALGCEYIKGMALMGVGCESGHVTVTDMDTIEPSNLTRQFLFRSQHVGLGKSEVGAEVVKTINPAINVTALVERIAPETEDYFTDDFWEDKDLIWNALDNVHARAYADVKCLWHNKPLLESGTMGTSCNSEIYLPFKTQSYQDGADEQSGAIPMCTVRNFPHLPIHAIEWAKIRFNELFVDGISNYQMAVENNAGFLDVVDKAGSAEEQLAVLEPVKRLFDAQSGGNFDFASCVRMAFADFHGQFRNRIMDLVHTYPENFVKPNGEAFWSGPRRFPKALPLDVNDPACTGMKFLFSCSSLFAAAFDLAAPYDQGSPLPEQYSAFCKFVKQMQLSEPAYTPKQLKLSAKEIGGGDEEDSKAGDENDPLAIEVDGLKAFFANTQTSGFLKATPAKFEKDDDSNHHIDFITHGTNLRSLNYGIAESTRQHVRVTAGRIIPALVTTTAMITGLNELEFCKLMMGLDCVDPEAFLNWNIALGVSNFNSFNPNPANRHTDYTDDEGEEHVAIPAGWTNWHKLVFDVGDVDGDALAALIAEKYGVKTEFLTSRGQSLWNASSANKGTQSLAQKFAALSSGAGATKDRNVARVVKEVMNLQKDSSAYTIAHNGPDEFQLRAVVLGPKGSFYEGGSYVVDISLPDNYPTGAPSVVFRTKIYHCNVDGAGKPCPDQVGLGGRWSASSNLRGLISNIITMLAEQDAESALIPARGKQFVASPSEFEATARQWVTNFAVADQSYEVPGAVAVEEAEVIGDISTLRENYLILEGHFTTMEAQPRTADLPLIKLVFRAAKVGATTVQVAAETTDSKVEESSSSPLQECDESTCQSVKALTIASEDEEELKIVSCYKLPADRASVYLNNAAVREGAKGLTWYNGIAVTCQTEDDEEVEMVVYPDQGSFVSVALIEDQISMSELSVTQMVEYQFEPGGRWFLGGCGAETAEYYRSGKFAEYDKLIRTVPPPCMATLRRLLQNGPVNRMFDPILFPTPDYDIHNWQVALKKGASIQITNIPHQVHALRVWNASSRSYDYIDSLLNGAPATEEAKLVWFKELIVFLKSNLHQAGSGASDPNLCLLFSESLDNCVTADGFRNEWTDLVLSIQPPFSM